MGSRGHGRCMCRGMWGQRALMFQASDSVEGSEASRSRSHFIAARVFVNMVLVVSGVPQASFWSAVGQFAGVGILEVMSLVEESLLYIRRAFLSRFFWPLEGPGCAFPPLEPPCLRLYSSCLFFLFEGERSESL